MYDWGNSAFITVIVTAVYPIYFQTVAASQLSPAAATSRFALVTSAALIVVAVLSPILGAVADVSGRRKQFLAAALGLGLVSTLLLWFVRDGDWQLGAVLFALGNVGVLLSLVFYDSLLPHIAADDEIDRVSTAGYALGYLGGGLLLLVCIALTLNPRAFGLADGGVAVRVGFLLVALWWLAFSFPVLLRVPEPPKRLEPDESPQQSSVRTAFVRLGETLGELRRYRQTFLLLLAVLIYNDGITTIYRLATTYGTEIGLPQNQLILAILMVQFVGVPFAFLFGSLAGWLGTKRAILMGLGVYLLVSVLGYFVTSATHFFVMAFMVGMVQGGVQALSRGLFASMVPKHKSSEFFGFFGVAERFSAVLGPLVFAAVTAATGTSRYAVVSIVVFFLVGGALLSRVDVEEGRRRAREEEALLT